MRGKLINPFLVVLYRMDSTATAIDPDGEGELTSGYDEDFREPRKLSTEATTNGTDARIDKEPLILLAQVEIMTMARMRQMWGGDAPETGVCCVFHFDALEAVELIDQESGEATIYKTTRLAEIRDHRTEDLVQAFRAKPGLFADRVESEFGGLGRHRNLLKVYFTDRPQAPLNS